MVCFGIYNMCHIRGIRPTRFCFLYVIIHGKLYINKKSLLLCNGLVYVLAMLYYIFYMENIFFSFQRVKDRCRGNPLWLPLNGERIMVSEG